MQSKNLLNGKTGAYAGLTFVIFIWGLSPLITNYLHNYFSPTIRIAMGTFICAISMFLISLSKLHLFNKTYLKIALPTGLCLGIADILQKIGLQYTTESNYAFLENLSVVVVPILLFILIRKKPSWLTVLAAVLCLASCFILTMLSDSTDATTELVNKKDPQWLGDVLCALSGVFYGINIAVTGIHAKKFFVPIYLAIQLMTEAVLSFVLAITLNSVGIEPIKFTFDVKYILFNIGFVLVSLTLGWLIRTWAMKSIAPTVVAIMMPFSAIVTVVASILLGNDTLSIELVIGAVLGLTAIILSGLGDKEPKKQKE